MAFNDKNRDMCWVTSASGIIRNSVVGLKYVYNEYIDFINYKQDKNYQFLTSVTGSNNLPLSIQFSNPFKYTEPIVLKTIRSANIGVKFYNYANPLNDFKTKDVIQYGAEATFNSITNSSLNEIEFLINGFREFSYIDLKTDDPKQPNGWCYSDPYTNELPGYTWYNSTTSDLISPSYSTYGSGNDSILTTQNYIAKIVSYDAFNLTFDYLKIGGVDDDILEIYMVPENKLKTEKLYNNWGNAINKFKTTQKDCKFTNLRGTNDDGTKNYLVFTVASRNSTNLISNISNIKIFGGYNDINNTTIQSTTDYKSIEIPNLNNDNLYTFDIVDKGKTYSVQSKIGNGTFQQGIWENGVWNNGYRVDDEVRDFDDIYSSIVYPGNISWKIKISGTTHSCDNFNIGDAVSIGNIVAIDINEERKLLIDYYKITDKLISDNISWLEVSLDTTFPYRRIEKDSPNHKIKITKNIWKSGVFFNGRFSGVWNTGLFKGYPKLTEMYDTHWINGFFEGGHFHSNYITAKILRVIPTDHCSIGNISLDYGRNDPGFIVGDYIIIEIDKNPYIKKTHNSSYNGIAKVLKTEIIDGLYTVTVNKLFTGYTIDDTTEEILYETGNSSRYTATSVIQNFKFYDTNRSKLKSSDTSSSTAVFSYNSWIDTNYDNNRAVTLSRDFRTYEPLTGKTINRTNLYGYPSYDILSSSSRFRNSFNLDYGLYKLGTKYKIYSDFVGEGSGFNDPFSETNIQPFFDMGWTYSTLSNDNVIIKRTEDIISKSDDEATQFRISGVTGDELYISATESGLIINNSNVNIEKSRYSVSEFDVITYSVNRYNYTYDNTQAYLIKEISATSSFSEIKLSDTELLSPKTLYGSDELIVDDIIVEVSLFSSIASLTINLVAPNGNIINLKENNKGYGGRLRNTKFSLKDNFIKFSDITTPYNLNNNFAYSDTYLIDNLPGQGDIYKSEDHSLELSDLISVLYGEWNLYVKGKEMPAISSWKLSVKYKENIKINSEPTSNFPVINLSNLNYEVSTYKSDFSSVNVYSKMSYLPISENINHLTTKNTFRLDSIENTSPDTYGGYGQNKNTKKYEYFYNKTDLMLNFMGNGPTGGSASMIVLDNIKMYEVDMIPFFKYFNDNNIYKGIQIPIEGVAPVIDYLDSDFVFVDNVTLGVDTISSDVVDNIISGTCSPPKTSLDKIIVKTIKSESETIKNEIEIEYHTGGEFIIKGDIHPTKVGIKWGNSYDELINDISLPITAEMLQNGYFQIIMSNLTFNTIYHVNAYITDGTKIWKDPIVINFTTVKQTPDYDSLDYNPYNISTNTGDYYAIP